MPNSGALISLPLYREAEPQSAQDQVDSLHGKMGTLQQKMDRLARLVDLMEAGATLPPARSNRPRLFLVKG